MKQRQIKIIVTILITITILITYVKPSMAIASDLLDMLKPVAQNIEKDIWNQVGSAINQIFGGGNSNLGNAFIDIGGDLIEHGLSGNTSINWGNYLETGLNAIIPQGSELSELADLAVDMFDKYTNNNGNISSNDIKKGITNLISANIDKSTDIGKIVSEISQVIGESDSTEELLQNLENQLLQNSSLDKKTINLITDTVKKYGNGDLNDMKGIISSAMDSLGLRENKTLKTAANFLTGIFGNTGSTSSISSNLAKGFAETLSKSDNKYVSGVANYIKDVLNGGSGIVDLGSDTIEKVIKDLGGTDSDAEKIIEDIGNALGIGSNSGGGNGTGSFGNKNPASSSNDIDTIDKVIQSGNDFLDAADDNTVNFSEESLQKLSKFISGVLLAIAIGVTVISVIILGINYTVQSIDEKAKIKESMVPWIIGIFIAFGAFAIWKITMSFFMKL